MGMDRLAVRGPLVQAAFNRDQIRERCSRSNVKPVWQTSISSLFCGSR